MTAERDAFLCAPGFEAALVAEAGGTARAAGPGVVVAPRPDSGVAGTDHVFARQVLPAIREVCGPSVSKLAHGAVDAVLPVLDGREERWDLHALVSDVPRDPNRPGELRRRANLVAEAFLAAMKMRRRRVHRRLAPGDAGTRVQLLLLERERLLVSAAAACALPGGGSWPSPFPAGIAPVADAPSAPSRAYRKLAEAFAWIGDRIRPGQRVVDLGAAPGGWTWVALRDGASEVQAVDRADLDPALDADPRVTHHRRTAFGWTPDSPPVDWLLSDVIAYPDRTLDLLRRWIDEGWARRVVLHLKFRGREDYAPAREAKEVLAASDYGRIRVKHLFHDRNEVTVLATDQARR